MRLPFGRRPVAPLQAAANRLHDALVDRIRQPDFYTAYAVPDTFEGRFDLMMLHVALVLRRLRELGPEGQALAQNLVDTTFARLDVAMRELGVSDIGVPKRMKRLAEAFKGRITAYHDALGRGDPEAFAAAVTRNVLAGRGDGTPLARYASAVMAALVTVPLAGFLDGEVDLPTLPFLHDPQLANGARA